MTAKKRSANSRLREGRRAERDQPRPDTRTAILLAVERLLADTTLHELRIARILEEAGVSRGSFYTYFESKYEVAAALLRLRMDELWGTFRPFVERDDEVDVQVVFEAAMRDALRYWRDNRALARAVHECWSTVPEIGDQWLASTERFTAQLTAELHRASGQGSPESVAETRKHIAAGLWSASHLLYVAGSGTSPDLTDDDSIIEMVVPLFSGLVFGEGKEESLTPG